MTAALASRSSRTRSVAGPSITTSRRTAPRACTRRCWSRPPYSLFEPIQSFLPPPRDPERWRPIAEHTLIVGSDDDDYAEASEFEALGAQLGARVRILPGQGHINAAAGFGPFPLALEWLAEVGALG